VCVSAHPNLLYANCVPSFGIQLYSEINLVWHGNSVLDRVVGTCNNIVTKGGVTMVYREFVSMHLDCESVRISGHTVLHCAGGPTDYAVLHFHGLLADNKHGEYIIGIPLDAIPEFVTNLAACYNSRPDKRNN